METQEAGKESGLFPPTQWTVVARLREQSSSGAERAMEQICRVYWRPMYVYARRFGLNESESKDAVQDLFLRLIDGNRVAMADAQKGRLRTFLLTALKNVISTNRERQSAAKRGGGKTVFSLDMADAEGAYMQEVEAHTLAPDAAFDRKWALELLGRAQIKLRAVYAKDGKEQLFDALAPALLEEHRWDGIAPTAAAQGMNEGAVKVALHRLRSRFRETLLKEIRDTVVEEADVPEEVSHLVALFSGQQA